MSCTIDVSTKPDQLLDNFSLTSRRRLLERRLCVVILKTPVVQIEVIGTLWKIHEIEHFIPFTRNYFVAEMISSIAKFDKSIIIDYAVHTVVISSIVGGFVWDQRQRHE